ELLVKNRADPNQSLFAAISHRYARAVDALLRLGATHTLVTAAGMGDVDLIRNLLASNPSPAERRRAMHVAVINGQFETTQCLLATGLDSNARRPRAFAPTVLHEAASFGHHRLVLHSG